MAVTTKATEFGMHTEQLAGRSQQRFFRSEEQERFTYPQAFEVDFKKRTQFDAGPLSTSEINLKLRELMSQGYGSIVMKNPGAKHSLAVGILNRLNLTIEGSLGYFGCGLIDGPNPGAPGGAKIWHFVLREMPCLFQCIECLVCVARFRTLSRIPDLICDAFSACSFSDVGHEYYAI